MHTTFNNVSAARLRKIHALAERGIDGERQTARRMLRKIYAQVGKGVRLLNSYSPAPVPAWAISIDAEFTNTLESLLWYPLSGGLITLYWKDGLYYIVPLSPTFCIDDLKEQFIGCAYVDTGKPGELHCKALRTTPPLTHLRPLAPMDLAA